MPLPPDNELQDQINTLYDAVREHSMQPTAIGVVTFRAARLQALSTRALILQLERNAIAQEKTDRVMERLQRTGLVLAIVAAALALVQVVVAR
jgi:hypothetical protein